MPDSVRSRERRDGVDLREHVEYSLGSRWRLSTVKFSDGERYPMLLDSAGIPDWNSTLFITTQVRNASKAPNTSISILSSIRVLLEWAENAGLDMVEGFEKGHFLTLPQLESLRDFAHCRAATFADFASPGRTSKSKTNNLRKTESINAERIPARKCVKNQSLYIRLTYIARYLRWVARQSAEPCQPQSSEDVQSLIASMVETLCELRPQIHSQSGVKKGLSQEAISCLLKLVDPASPENPFEISVRTRNYLMVLLLGSTGLRGGELLGLKVTDFQFELNEFLILRRHGDPTDPRSNQPVAKTNDRRLPLHGYLSDAIFNYVLRERKGFPRARKHSFLFVTHQAGKYQGDPLSKAALEKVFAKLREAAPEILKDLTPHSLRHTANDDFSRVAEQNKLPIAIEEKLRSYSMGWKEGSGAARKYTRRYIEEQAQKAMLDLQKRWILREKQ